MLLSEKICTFAEAAKRLPRIDGRRPHTSTVWRWARRGIFGIRLECRRIGGRFVTSTEALDRFTARLAQRTPEQITQHRDAHRHRAKPTNVQRQRAIANAECELAQDGI